MEIRPATTDDIEQLLPLVRAYREFYKQSHDAQRERTYISDHLRNGTSAILLACEDGGEAIGFAQLFQTFSTVYLAPAMILEDLFVIPRARGNGTASALLEAARRYAIDRGASQMFLETAMDNTTAQRVYERNGWTREATFYKYNADLGRY